MLLKIKDQNNMKKFSLKYKIVALLLVLAFTTQSMETINSHTYKVGVDSYHYECGCFGCYPTHLSATCKSDKFH